MEYCFMMQQNYFSLSIQEGAIYKLFSHDSADRWDKYFIYYIQFWFSTPLNQRLHWAIKRGVLEVPSFSCVSVPVHVSLYIQTSIFPCSLKSQTKAYLCKVLGNLPSFFQHIGACLTLTRAPPLSNSRLQHLWPLNSLSVSPSTCQRQAGLPAHSNT